MRPTCYYLESTATGARLYLGEVSTEDCLQVFDSSESVTVAALGATVGGKGWFDQDDLPSVSSVDALLSFLQTRNDIEIFDFSAKVGSVSLSTHDDGEAQLDFQTPSEPLVFLRRALEATLAERAIAALVKHPGKYISLGDTVRVFDTFDEYVIGV